MPASEAVVAEAPAQNDRTIAQAISEVLKNSAPLTGAEIYERIVARSLYRFRAQDPLNIVVVQIRRHCRGLDFATAEPMKYFGLAGDGRYVLLPKPYRDDRHGRKKQPKGGRSQRVSFAELSDLHDLYMAQVRSDVLSQLKKLTPTEFEHFGTRLLKAYGFSRLEVTPPSRDGGIDGFGHLKVGLAELRAAFQCKRWNKGSIGIFEVQRFRGAIQGKADQGVFFTTAHYSSDAQRESFVPGAVPVVLIDGPSIVSIMIERRVGITMESLDIPRPAVDLVIQPEDT